MSGSHLSPAHNLTQSRRAYVVCHSHCTLSCTENDRCVVLRISALITQQKITAPHFHKPETTKIWDCCGVCLFLHGISSCTKIICQQRRGRWLIDSLCKTTLCGSAKVALMCMQAAHKVIFMGMMACKNYCLRMFDRLEQVLLLKQTDGAKKWGEQGMHRRLGCSIGLH